MWETKSRALPSFAAAALLLAGSCDQKPARQVAGPAETSTTRPSPALNAGDLESVTAYLQQTVTPRTGGLPAEHPPLSRVPRLPSELQYEAPAAWTAQPPSSSMRKAQYVLPRAAGDPEDGELVVYYFGPGQGGSVADNIARWRGMFVTRDDEPLGDDAVQQDIFEVNRLRVTVIDMRGDYRASLMPGMTPTAPKREDYRMLAAIIETPAGPWFFKAVGPAATMTAHREAFVALVRSVRYPADG